MFVPVTLQERVIMLFVLDMVTPARMWTSFAQTSAQEACAVWQHVLNHIVWMHEICAESSVVNHHVGVQLRYCDATSIDGEPFLRLLDFESCFPLNSFRSSSTQRHSFAFSTCWPESDLNVTAWFPSQQCGQLVKSIILSGENNRKRQSWILVHWHVDAPELHHLHQQKPHAIPLALTLSLIEPRPSAFPPLSQKGPSPPSTPSCSTRQQKHTPQKPVTPLPNPASAHPQPP